MHVAFALMIGWPLARLVSTAVARVLWLLYPLLMTFVIVVTANHFIVDALLGALTAGASAYGARWLARARPEAWRFAGASRRGCGERLGGRRRWRPDSTPVRAARGAPAHRAQRAACARRSARASGASSSATG